MFFKSSKFRRFAAPLVTLLAVFALSAPVFSQTAKFQSIKEQSIRVQDVPKPEESIVPKTLSSNAKLPKVPKLETLYEARDIVAKNVFTIHVREKPISGMQRYTTVATGHAVWIKGAEGPLLVTCAHWVDEAVEIYLDTELPDADSLKAQTRTLERQSYGKDATKKFRKNKERYLEVETAEIDKNRNLAVLKIKSEFTPPDGLALFPIETEAASRTYGFSPMMGSVLIQALFYAPSKKLEMSFYLQTDFRGTLGAPIVDSEGRLVALTAFMHPKNDQRILVVPPVALRVFLEKVAGKVTPKP